MNSLPSIGAGIPVLGSLLPSLEESSPPFERLYIRTILYKRSLEAMNSFETGRFRSLDPPAGDHACQIRALQFSMLKLERVDALKKTIEERVSTLADLEATFSLEERKLKAKVEAIQRERLNPLVEEGEKIRQERERLLSTIAKKDRRQKEIKIRFLEKFSALELKKEPIRELIQKERQNCLLNQQKILEDRGIEMFVDQASILVIRSYLVTLAKVDKLNQKDEVLTYRMRDNPKILNKEEFSVQAKLLSEIVEKAKLALSTKSIAFVQKEAELIDCKRLKKFVASPRFVGIKGRAELPCFYYSRVIFQRAMSEKIPLFLKVRNRFSNPLKEESYVCSVLFTSDGSSYKMSPLVLEDMKRRVIVIEGYSKQTIEALKTSEYIEHLLKSSGGILRMIDLNTVQHAQYTDQIDCESKMFQLVPGMEDEEERTLVSLFDEAIKSGFSSRNPMQLCIEHVFCDLLVNQCRVERGGMFSDRELQADLLDSHSEI